MQINKMISPYNHYNGRGGHGIKFIVIHYVGALGGAKENCQYYASGDVGASAHYYVGFGGEIWQSVEDANGAWSVGGGRQTNEGGAYYGQCNNYNSLNIEMCVRKGSTRTMNATDRDWYFEDATVRSAIELTKHLMAKYGIPASRVIRHYDVNGKICPNPYVYNHTKHTWAAFKAALTGSSGSNTPDNSGSTSDHSTLSYGATGPEVKTMQTMLIALGYTCGASGADGVWGLDTNKAVRAFQSAHTADGIIVDEICGPATWRVLEAAYKAITAPQPSEGTYTVQAGDTLYRIAQTAGTTVDKLAQLNSLQDPAKITVGQVLKLPGAKTHTVKAGDTLSALARTYGTTVDKIVNGNKVKYPAITANHIVVGWVLRV